MKSIRGFSMLALTLGFLVGGVQLGYADDAKMKQDDSMVIQKDDGAKKDTMMKGNDPLWTTKTLRRLRSPRRQASDGF